MMQSMIIAIGGIVTMMLIWTAVQAIWRRVFAEHLTDEDVLAERRSCGDCGCGLVCTKKKISRPK